MQGGEGEKFAFNFEAASGEAEAEPQAEGVVDGEEQHPAGEGEEEQQEGYEEEEEQYDEEEEYVAPAEEVQFSRSVRVRASIQQEPRFPTHASCIIGMWVC